MITVEEKIRSIAEQIKGVNYIFDSWQNANIRLDEEQFPVIVNVLPASGTLKLGKQQLKDFQNCMIAFLDKTDFDFDSLENNAIVERCKNIAKEFILRVNESDLFEDIEEEIFYSVIYDKLDANVTGIMIELELRETKGLVVCYGKPIDRYFNGER
jgi:hypothetical protein